MFVGVSLVCAFLFNAAMIVRYISLHLIIIIIIIISKFFDE